jgi:hypothetical protein
VTIEKNKQTYGECRLYPTYEKLQKCMNKNLAQAIGVVEAQKNNINNQ